MRKAAKRVIIPVLYGLRNLASAAGLIWVLMVGFHAASSAQLLRPVEIIVPFGTGGGADELARFCAPLLEQEDRAPVTVTNVPGSTGNVGMARLLSAPSDGTTLAVLTGDTYASLAYYNAPWNTKDVTPLAILTRQSSALFVAASSPFQSWQDFEAKARKSPRALRVAISGYGSPDYISLEQLDTKGIHLAPLPLDNPEERYQALLSGAADALYEQPGDVRSFTESAKMRPLLMFGVSRESEFKDVPSSAEVGMGSGLPQFRAVVVKAGTDPQIVKALAEAFARIAAMPEFNSFLARQYAAPSSFVAAESAPAFMQSQMDVMRKVVEGMPLHAQYPISDSHQDEPAPPSFKGRSYLGASRIASNSYVLRWLDKAIASV